MESLIVVYIVVSVVSLAVLYLLIRAGARHGVREALRDHEMWKRDGSLERAIDAHAARIVEAQDVARLEQAARRG